MNNLYIYWRVETVWNENGPTYVFNISVVIHTSNLLVTMIRCRDYEKILQLKTEISSFFVFKVKNLNIFWIFWCNFHSNMFKMCRFGHKCAKQCKVFDLKMYILYNFRNFRLSSMKEDIKQVQMCIFEFWYRYQIIFYQLSVGYFKINFSIQNC